MQVETFTLKYSDLDIPRSALTTAMGYAAESPPPVESVIDEVLERGGELCEIQAGYRIVDSIRLEKEGFVAEIDGASFHIHKVVFRQLNAARRVAVFVCTAGRRITERTTELMKGGDLLTGYVNDVFGSLVVEAAMDIVQGGLKTKMKETGLKITNRYSPGYCGWEITEQKRLFGLLPRHFCGVELTDSCLMLPTKSISGIIGIGESVKYNPYSCNLCDARNCLYKNIKRKAD